MLALLLCAVVFVLITGRLVRGNHSLWIRLTSSLATFTFLLLSVAWFTANAFTGAGVNGAVFYHLRTGFDGAGLREYGTLIALFFLALGGALFLAILVYRGTARSRTVASGWQNALLAIALPILCLLHPTVNATFRDFSAALYGSDSLLNSALGVEQVDESFQTYFKKPANIWPASPHRNLVVIYAESLEQTYFDEKLFPGLITELRTLQNQARSYTDIRSVEGTGFTIAGLVASQCGVPLITTGHPNSMRGMDRFLSGASCIGDLLKAQDYSLHYLGGADLSFAGKGSFFDTHGFESVMGLQELKPLLDDPQYVSSWGLYDDFLLTQFLNRFDELSRKDRPFGLFGLTMDTHHPHGHQSRSCDGLEYGDGSNRMLNAVHCADHLLAKTLRTILASPAAANTLVVLASDHLALKNDAYELLTKGKRRNLLWIFSPDGKPGSIRQPGTTMDTSVALLKGLGADIEALALGRDINAKQKSLVTSLPNINGQLKAWRKEFAGLWELPEEIKQLILDSQNRVLQINERRFQAPALVTLDDSRMTSIRFEFDSRQHLYEYVQTLPPGATFLWFDECGKVRALDLTLPVTGLCYFAGNIDGSSIAAAPVTNVDALDGKTLQKLSDSFASSRAFTKRRERLGTLKKYGVADLRQSDVTTSLLDVGTRLRVHSAGGPKARSALLTSSHRQAIQRGIQLFALEKGGPPELIAHYDLCKKNPEPAVPAAELLLERDDRGSDAAYLLVAHDSPTCGASLEPLLRGLPLTKWTNLGFREPYIALFSLNSAENSLEFTGDRYAQLRVVFSGADLLASSETQ